MMKPAVPDNFDHQHKITSMFSDNAKTYVQLSGAALALTLTFAHEILHIPKEQNIADGWMIAMWICFLVAIITGAFYQYLAVKFLERSLDAQSYDIWNWLQPGRIYGVMLGAFYGGHHNLHDLCHPQTPPSPVITSADAVDLSLLRQCGYTAATLSPAAKDRFSADDRLSISTSGISASLAERIRLPIHWTGSEVLMALVQEKLLRYSRPCAYRA